MDLTNSSFQLTSSSDIIESSNSLMTMFLNQQQQRIQWQLQQLYYQQQPFCTFGHHHHHSSLGPLQQPQNFTIQQIPPLCIYQQFHQHNHCNNCFSSCNNNNNNNNNNLIFPFDTTMHPFQPTFCQYLSYLPISAMSGGFSSSSLSSTITTTTTLSTATTTPTTSTATGFQCNIQQAYNQQTGNPWLTSCPNSSTMSNSSTDSYGFDRLNTRLRDDSAARLQQLISLPEDSDKPIDLDVLMPNGTIIPINIAQNATFFEIKEEVFELSQRGPMYGALRDRKLYSFYYVDEFGTQKECVDEEIRLCDACPVGNILKLIEHQENIDDLELDEQIGQLIGKSLKDFDALLNPEVNEFRYRMRSLCEEIVKTRQNNSWLDKMRYAYPTSVDPSDLKVLPDYLRDRLPSDGVINVQIIFDEPKFTIMVAVNCQITPSELLRQSIELILNDPIQSKELIDNQMNSYNSYYLNGDDDDDDDNDQEESYYESSFPTDINSNSIKNNSSNNPFLDSSQYLLKINGTLEYLLDNHRLIQYRIIQEILLSNNPILKISAIPRHCIEFEDEPIYAINTALSCDFRPRSHSIISLGSLGSVIMSTTASRRRAQQSVISSWSLDRKLLIKIHSAHINQLQFNSDITRVAVMVGIFHGGEMLCDSHITTPVTLADLVKSSPQNPNMEIFDTIPWEEDIVFNLKVSDLPRMARIAFTVVGFTGSQSARKMAQLRQKPIPIAWANINFFDYRGQLWESSTTLSMWLHDNENECVDDTQSVFKPLETVVPNPNIDQTIFLTISFTKYSEGDNTVIRFPTLKEILTVYPTQQNQQQQNESSVTSNIETSESKNRKNSALTLYEENEYESTYNPRERKNSSLSINNHQSEESQSIINNSSIYEESLEEREQNLNLIKKISEEDLLHRIEEKHRELLWKLRFECCKQCPESLCKLLISFKWNNQRMIGEAISLLQLWPKLSPCKALELLDYAYADNLVRKYAIECLKDLSNDDLSQYLLQLVQALKYESYIYNDLVQFLLERAFESQRIGHHLFWLLRSEMHNPAVSVTFGLILEAYCRGAIDHIYILSRQMECLNKLKRVNIIIRDDRSRENRDKKICWMQEILEQKFYQETFTNVINPLNPIYKFGRLKIKKCKFMDSKMKPLWLVFENCDSDAGDIYLIFKNGDDLRQDMLTLQMIRIMDRLWKEAGYDFRMTPYRCISVEHCVGLIEVVLNADTIANIQKNKGNAAIAAFKKGSLLAWLRDHNPQESDLNRAIEEFTLSCAGYCVATYILGIADRHNDNIMVKKNGQLFHIDFGHILGKFKEKFGIRRERVPFVLTHDFVYVITHGEQSSKKSEYFRRFQRYCEEAFIIIRRRGSFIISLFAMMLSTGIPEISSVNDLQYLRETLVLDKNEDEARAHFNMKFMEALKNSWKTSLNWCAHSLAKDNRMNDR